MTTTRPATDASYYMNPDEASNLLDLLRTAGIYDWRTSEATDGLVYVTVGPKSYAHLTTLPLAQDGHIDATGYMHVDGLDYEWHARDTWDR